MNSAWKIATIGDVCDLISGQHIAANDYNRDRLGIGYLTGPSDFGDIHPSVSKWTEHPKKTAIHGDILVTVKGSGVGKINLLTDEEVAISRQLVAVRVTGADRGYVLAFLTLQSSVLGDLASGAAIPGLSREDILRLPIPLPPLPEQRRIAAILDEAFEGIAAAVANAEKNLANARELFESYLNSVFTRKGEGWVESRLDQISENLDSRRIPITKSKRKSGDIPYYGASGVVDHVADYIFDEDLLLVSEDGANLLARTYPIAFSISGKAWVNNHAHVLRFEDIHTQRFTEYYLNSISLAPYVSGMAQPKLNQKALNSIRVPVPPKEERERIVAELNILTAEADRLQAVYRQKLTALAEFKQSILQKAFAGELTAGAPEREAAA